LKLLNIDYIESKEQEFIVNSINDIGKCINIDKDIGAVIVGIDFRITYAKIVYALHALRTLDNCLYIATNLDSTYPYTEEVITPGAGSIVSMMTTSYGKDPIIIGKPYNILFNLVEQQNPNLDKERTCMVGDRLDTDILFGINNGIKTLVVYTGIVTREESKSQSTIIPDFQIDSVSYLKHLYEKSQLNHFK